MNPKIIKKPGNLFRSLATLILCFVSNYLTAQPNFVLDTIYKPSITFSKISSMGLTDIWAIGGNDNRSIFRLFEKNITDQSTAFQAITNKPFTDIHTMGTNNVIVGTGGDYLYQYNNGTFTHIDAKSGLGSASIQLITANYFNTTRIQTDQGIYTTADFKNITKFTGPANSESLVSRGSYSIYKYLSYGELRVQMNDAASTIWTIPPSEIIYNDLLAVDPLYNEFGANNLAGFYYGTTNGLYYLSVYQSKYYYLPNHKINVIMPYDVNYHLVGADDGLYLIYKYGPPVKITLDGVNREIFDIWLHNGCVYASTNLGLLKIYNTNCNTFDAAFTQDKKTINLATNTPVSFTQTCADCPKTTLWNFGDNTTSTLENPSHLYAQSGNMQVLLTSTNKTCSSQAKGEVVVFNDSLAYANGFLQNSKFLAITNAKYAGSKKIIVKDFNNDGKPDILLHKQNGACLNYMLINRGNDFEEVTTPFSSAINYGVLAGDFNNDGFIDVLSQVDNKPVSLFINKGNLSFDRIQTVIPFLSKICLAGDYDNDGFLDVLVVNDNFAKLYHNNKGQSFTVDNRTNFGNIIYPLFATWMDINNDNYLDLYIVAQDKNHIFINQGNGIFSEVSIPELNTVNNGTEDYLASWGDFNNDGKFDLVRLTGQGNKLFTNNGQYSFTEALNGAIVNDIHYSSPISADWTDINNDGRQDLIICSQNYTENKCYINNGNGVFYNDTSNIFTKANNDWTSALISEDMDMDGDMDIIEITGSTNSTPPTPPYFFENKGNSYKWVNIKCYGTKSNYEAIGARVRIKANIGGKDVWQIKLINCIAGINAQESGMLHFGLGNAPKIDSLIVYWPSGDTSYFSNLGLNKMYNIIEPDFRIIGDTVTCANEFPLFKMPDINNVLYHWYYNDIAIDSVKGNDLMAKAQGTYKVKIYSPDLGEYESKTTRITFKPLTKETVKFADAIAFCDGDSVKVVANYNAKIKYRWYQHEPVSDLPLDTFQYAYARNDSGVYCVFINEFNCKDTSALLISTVYPLPNVKLCNDTSICYGDSLLLVAGINDYNYKWNTNATSPQICVKDQGKYSVTATDSHNCHKSDTIVVNLLPLPDVFLGNNTTIGYFDDLFISLPAGYKNYVWQDSLLSGSRTITGSNTGFGKHQFKVTVMDNKGCKNADSIMVTIVFNMQMDSVQNQSIVIFPNPASSVVSVYTNFSSDAGDTKIEIIDATGKIISSSLNNLSSEKISKIYLNGLKHDLYFIKFSNKKVNKVLKLQAN